MLLVLAFFGVEASARICQQSNEPSKSYLSVVMRIRKDGSFEIIKATQLSGEVVLRDFQTSDFIYEVTSGAQTLAVAFLAEDPFLVRSLGDPADSKEDIAQGKSAVIVINIPLKDSASAIRKLGLRIFKLVPGTSVSEMDCPTLQELKAQKKLTIITDLPAKTFGRSIATKLSKLRQ